MTPEATGASDPQAGKGEGGTWPESASQEAGRKNPARRVVRAKAGTCWLQCVSLLRELEVR